jgi:DNA-binding XRE family transcriptional regulator
MLPGPRPAGVRTLAGGPPGAIARSITLSNLCCQKPHGYIERGDYNPSLDLALRIAELFLLPIEAIFGRSPMQPLSSAIFGDQGRESVQ